MRKTLSSIGKILWFKNSQFEIWKKYLGDGEIFNILYWFSESGLSAVRSVPPMTLFVEADMCTLCNTFLQRLIETLRLENQVTLSASKGKVLKSRCHTWMDLD